MKKNDRSATRGSKEEAVLVTQPAIVSRPRHKVFISHDSRDADLAEAFQKLLTNTSAGMLKSFRSSDRKGTTGIEFGEPWYDAIMDELKEASDVVALLTNNSIDRPWILYETGVARGMLNRKVIGLALGIPLSRAVTGPFAHFQNSGDDEDQLTKLVLQLLTRIPDASPSEEAIQLHVKQFRQSATAIVASKGTPITETDTAIEASNVVKMFEEVKLMHASLPQKIEQMLQETRRPRRSIRRMFHPMMFEDIMFHPEMRHSEGGAAMAWLVIISSFREDLPWLYDLGMEVYKALRYGSPDEIEIAEKGFNSALKVIMHSPFVDSMIEDKEMDMMLHHIPELLRDLLRRARKDRFRRPHKKGGGEATNSEELSS